MRGPRCPRCHQSEWQLIHNDEQRQRWPVTCGETIYQCVTGTVHGFVRLGRLVPSAGDALASAARFLRRRI